MATFRPIGTDLSSVGSLANSDYSQAVSSAGIVQHRVASGQITITDLNDGRLIQSYTTSSLGDTQVYKPDTKVYTPDYTVTGAPQIIKAQIFMSGQNTDLAPTPNCSGWKWTVDGSDELPTSANASGNQLAISRNIEVRARVLRIGWECMCTDPDSQVSVKVAGGKTLSLVESAGATGLVVIEQPNGNTFNSTGKLTTLVGRARLMRGGVHDTTVKSAEWEALDITQGVWVTVTKGVKALTNDGVSEIGITADDVLNFQTYRCTMTDDDTNETFSGIATFLDASDPYMVELYTLTGDVIRNGEGSTTVYARLWRNGEIIEDGESRLYNYGFSKFNAQGVATAWDDTTDGTMALNNVVKFGNPIVVKAADVIKKATIYCNVTRKLSS